MARTHRRPSSHQSETQSESSTHKADHPARFESAAFSPQPQLTPAHLTRGVVMALQRTHGNRFVQRLVDSVRQNAPAVTQRPAQFGLIQREITDPGELWIKGDKLRQDMAGFYKSLSEADEIEAILKKQTKSLCPEKDLAKILKKDPVPGADGIMDKYRALLDHLQDVHSRYAKMKPTYGDTSKMTGFGVPEAQAKFIAALKTLTIDGPFDLQPIRDLEREHERAERTDQSIKALRNNIETMIGKGLQDYPTKRDKQQLLDDLQTIEQEKATGTSSTLNNKIAKLKRDYEAINDELKVRQKRFDSKIQNRQTPDGEFYRNPTVKTLTTLLSENKISRGDVTEGPSRNNQDSMTGFSLTLSITNMKDYEIHVHCSHDGSVAGGRNPVHFKLKGGRYELHQSIFLPEGDVRNQLLPSQEQRFSMYKNSEIYVEPPVVEKEPV